MTDEMKQGLAEILEVSDASITPDFRLTDGNWDSMAIISAIALIDQEYDITLDARSLKECQTVAELLAVVESAARKKSETAS